MSQKSHHSLTHRCTSTQMVKAISILSPADYIWRGNSDWTRGEDGAQDRQSRDACLNIFTLLNPPPPSLLPPLAPSLSKQWGLEEQRAVEWTEGGRERRGSGTLSNSTQSFSNKRSPIREPPRSSSQSENRVGSKRMRAKERAKEWEREKEWVNKRMGKWKTEWRLAGSFLYSAWQ